MKTLLAAVLLCGARASGASAPDGCVACHSDERFRVEDKKLFDYYHAWKGSPHDRAGLSCSTCHGGDPGAANKGDAHKGVLPPSDPESPLGFRSIPKTCGACHAEVLEAFERSKHFEKLRTEGKGPNCVTCHGSMNARVDPTSVVERACSQCHAPGKKNHPEVPAKAEAILRDLRYANAYRKGLAAQRDSAGRRAELKRADASYHAVVRSWHEFDFKTIAPRAKSLLAALKALYAVDHPSGADAGAP